MSLLGIVTFVMHLFAMKSMIYIRSFGRWQVVGFRSGAMVEKIEFVYSDSSLCGVIAVVLTSYYGW